MAACAAFLACAAGCGGTAEDDALALYAAASLRDVVRELAPACERATGIRVAPHFAGSGVLARQIELGGRADLFFSADASWVDRLQRAGQVEPGDRVDLLANALVLVVPRDRALAGPAGDPDPTLAEALAGVAGRVAIADPETVPAGRYARAWIEHAGLAQALASRLVPTLDVRAALAAVESGAADAGVVYATDAAVSERVRVAAVAPPGATPPIVYAVAALAGRPRIEDARRVVAWLAGDEARPVFERHGFEVRRGEAR